MRTLEIMDGVVQNAIVIEHADRSWYEENTGSTLVDVEDDVGADIGDTYDAETGAFCRDGKPLGENEQDE